LAIRSKRPPGPVGLTALRQLSSLCRLPLAKARSPIDLLLRRTFAACTLRAWPGCEAISLPAFFVQTSMRCSQLGNALQSGVPLEVPQLLKEVSVSTNLPLRPCTAPAIFFRNLGSLGAFGQWRNSTRHQQPVSSLYSCAIGARCTASDRLQTVQCGGSFGNQGSSTSADRWPQRFHMDVIPAGEHT